MNAITLDTGALIALERRRQRMTDLLKLARTEGVVLVTPGVCVAEWWRARTDARERILAGIVVEHTDDALVKAAGEALASVPGASCIDALVMATAARRGGPVFTSDVDDLVRLQSVFPAVRVLRV